MKGEAIMKNNQEMNIINANNEVVNEKENTTMRNTVAMQRFFENMTLNALTSCLTDHEMAEQAQAELDRRRARVNELLQNLEVKNGEWSICGYKVYETPEELPECAKFIYEKIDRILAPTPVKDYFRHGFPVIMASNGYRIPLYYAQFYKTFHGTKVCCGGSGEWVEDVNGYKIPIERAIDVMAFGYVDEADIDEEDIVYARDGSDYEYMHVDDAYYCEFTGEWHNTNEVLSLHCNCGEYHQQWISSEGADLQGLLVDENSDSAYCQYCHSVCDECGCVVSNDDIHYSEISERGLCDECYDEYGLHVTDVFDGRFPGYFGDVENNKTLGVELEMEYGGESGTKAEYIINGHPAYTATDDGSLTEGIEIVSGACTLKYHKFAMDWKGLVERAKEMGYDYNSPGAGMHVHIGRDFFDGPEAEIRFGKFFNERFDTIIRAWGRKPREEFRPHRFYHKYDFKANWNNIIKGVAPEGRYHCVNYRNLHTIEVRMFGSVLDYEHIISALELVDVVAELANQDVDKITWKMVREEARIRGHEILLKKIADF